jgi:hypothetical protein
MDNGTHECRGSPSPVHNPRHLLSAILPNGKLTTVDVIVDGSNVQPKGSAIKSPESDSPRRKSTRVRSESAASESSELGNHPDKRRSARARAETNDSDTIRVNGDQRARQQQNLNGSCKDKRFVQNILGDDGNQYYCALCLDVGDVVCCDECPKVYHPLCIPEGCESRKSMDADEDPWFCPDCMASGKTRSTSGNKKGRSIRNVNQKLSIQSSFPFGNGQNGMPARQRDNGTSPRTMPQAKRGPSPNDRMKKPKKIVEGEEVIEESNERYSPYESQLLRNERGIVRAVSPFYYYLLDNRIRLERQLGRKNRSFKRAQNGYDKNLMVAKEGLSWWKRASHHDRKRYLDHAMNEFEHNVTLWKEEETIKEMYQLVDEPIEFPNEDSFADYSPDDEKYWKKKMRNLISCSKIECNRSKPQQNTILMELLQDTRFHPLPMIKPNREPSIVENPDYSGMVVPHFNVQGPIATCVGDQCIGCTRGWNHHCPILGRQFPAVEHRAKLQPPYPSFMATRIGTEIPPETLEDSRIHVDGAKRYRDVQTLTLTEPSLRGDDVMNFVDKLVAVKMTKVVPKFEGEHKQLTRGILPTKWKVGGSDDSKENTFICGKCKSTINTGQGCISCRRAQLLVDASKQEGHDEHELTAKMHTAMLPRANIKMDDFEQQSKFDKNIARALVAKPWKPNTILPPIAKVFPPDNPPPSSDKEETSDDEASTASSEKDEVESSESSIEVRDIASKPETSLTTSTKEVDDAEIIKESAPKKQAPRRFPRRGHSNSVDNSASAVNDDRQARELAYKDKSAELQSRCLLIATCGILLGLIRRDPLRLFAEPVPINVESYYKIIKNPIDFSKIKAKVLAGEYNTLGAFASDAKLLCINSLIYNPPGTIYATTAYELRDAFDVMQKRASDWILAIKNAHASYYSRRGRVSQQLKGNGKRSLSFDEQDMHKDADLFYELRKSWPGAIDLLEENGDWMRSQLSAEFVRTKENETAYYGALSIRRAAVAAEASLAPIYDADKIFQPCIRRSHFDDELLRTRIDREVAKSSDLSKLQQYPSWREGDVLGLMKKVQKWRVDKKTSPDELCGRCVSSQIHGEAKLARYAESSRKRRRLDEIQVRIADSRKKQSTGMASKKERDRIAVLDLKKETRGQNSVTVRGSQIQGWGLYADHSFQRGEVVAEYVGEYVVNPVTDIREKMYAEGRIQDYQFRVSANLVIDATKHGGFARYINHSCDPNCVAKIIDGDEPNTHLKRVIVSSQRSIEAGEEITYDYQFPIELNLDERLPCSCGAKTCRGFMNWDLPESSSLISRARTSRGRKERIRNLVRKEMK